MPGPAAPSSPHKVEVEMRHDIGVENFLFGTDSPPLFVLKKEGVDLINRMGLSAADKNKVYYENAKRLLKL